jgi:hypothetical protein
MTSVACSKWTEGWLASSSLTLHGLSPTSAGLSRAPSTRSVVVYSARGSHATAKNESAGLTLVFSRQSVVVFDVLFGLNRDGHVPAVARVGLGPVARVTHRHGGVPGRGIERQPDGASLPDHPPDGTVVRGPRAGTAGLCPEWD